jgi:hypothetical protein
VPRLTLVTLECTPVDIAMSVVEQGSAVYSPAVLHPGSHHQPPLTWGVGTPTEIPALRIRLCLHA